MTPPFPPVSPRPEDPRSYPDGIAFLDGQYVAMPEAKISVLDWGFLHSDATYDTVHVWRGAFFRLEAHLDRFLENAARLRLTLPHGRDEIADILATCVGLSGLRDAYVEMICTRGTSPSFSRDPRAAINRFMAFAVPFGSVADADQLRRGLEVAVTGIERIPPASLDPRIKNYHWLDLVHGLYEAYDRGAETALLVDADGNVAEGPGFNIFAVTDGQMATPAAGVLPGVTRRTVLEIAAELGVPAATRPLPVAELLAAEEAFITSTAGGVMPVTRVNGAAIGTGTVGPLATRIKDLYWARHDHPAWRREVAYP